MAPLKGVVIEVGTTLVVRLNSGAKLVIDTEKDFRVGDPIWLLWDYTHGECVGVWTETERFEDGNPGQPPEGLWAYPGFDPDNERPPVDPNEDLRCLS